MQLVPHFRVNLVEDPATTREANMATQPADNPGDTPPETPVPPADTGEPTAPTEIPETGPDFDRPETGPIEMPPPD
jgi:hypothetical protein